MDIRRRLLAFFGTHQEPAPIRAGLCAYDVNRAGEAPDPDDPLAAGVKAQQFCGAGVGRHPATLLVRTLILVGPLLNRNHIVPPSPTAVTTSTPSSLNDLGGSFRSVRKGAPLRNENCSSTGVPLSPGRQTDTNDWARGALKGLTTVGQSDPLEARVASATHSARQHATTKPPKAAGSHARFPPQNL